MVPGKSTKNTYSQCKKLFRTGCYEIVKPWKVSASAAIPSHIPSPVNEALLEPVIKVPSEQGMVRSSCRVTAELLHHLLGWVKVGVTTDELDRAATNFCIKRGVYPSPLNYEGFPKSICTSVNNVVCHGIPDDRPLADGDLINIDVSLFKDGFHGDCSKTVAVGSIDEQGQSLINASEACLMSGINVCFDGRPFSDIGEAVEKEATRRGFSVIPAVAGHGVGSQFHEPPDIYHFANSPDCGIMKTGMIFTIEPAITDGDVEIEILEDGWTAVTVDNSRSAQAEHTILITSTGPEILTVYQESTVLS